MPGPALSTLVPSKDSEPKKKRESEPNCAEPGARKGNGKTAARVPSPALGEIPRWVCDLRYLESWERVIAVVTPASSSQNSSQTELSWRSKFSALHGPIPNSDPRCHESLWLMECAGGYFRMLICFLLDPDLFGVLFAWVRRLEHKAQITKEANGRIVRQPS